MDDNKRGVIVNRMGAFVAVPLTFISDERITNTGRCLYMLLSSYTSAKADDQIAFPSYETIMKRLGWGSKVTVAAALLNLMQHGWIERKRRYSSSSIYTINYAPGEYRPEIELSPVVQKVNRHKSTNKTSDSSESGRQPEVPKQKVKEQEVEQRPRRKLSGFAAVHTEHPDERVTAYMDILAQKQITDTTAESIMKRITPGVCDVWKQILTAWAIGGDRGPYRADNLTGLFDRFDAVMNSRRFSKPASQSQWRPAKGMYPQVPDPTPAERAAAEEKAKHWNAQIMQLEAEIAESIDHSKTTEVPF